MLNDLDFAPTHVRADYCDEADEVAEQTSRPVSEAELAAWEEHPWF